MCVHFDICFNYFDVSEIFFHFESNRFSFQSINICLYYISDRVIIYFYMENTSNRDKPNATSNKNLPNPCDKMNFDELVAYAIKDPQHRDDIRRQYFTRTPIIKTPVAFYLEEDKKEEGE